MIEPTPGGVVRASAEPASKESAEQTQQTTFERALERQQSARARAKAARPERKDEPPQSAADALDPTSRAAVELATAAPPKATTQAAQSEQTAASPSSPALPQRPANSHASKPSAAANPASGGNPPAPAHTRAAGPNGTSPPAARDAHGGRSVPTHGSPTNRAASIPSRLSVPPSPMPLSAARPPRPTAASRASSIQSLIAGGRPTPGSPPKLPSSIKTHSQPAPRPAPSDEAPEAQFSRGLAAALRQGGGSVTLRLNPEQLGDLTIKLHFQQGSVDARFEAATDQARGLLNDSIDALRAALEARGLEVDRLSVHVAERPQHESQDATPRDAGHPGQGHGRHRPEQEAGHGSPRHAARTPHSDHRAELLVIPDALADACAGLGGALRLDAIA
jgi:flagellar hook-length control protein FliK